MTKANDKDTKTKTLFKTNNESVKMTFSNFIISSKSLEYFGGTGSHDMQIFCEFPLWF